MKKLKLFPAGYGHIKVTIIYYKKEYSTVTNNTHLIDAYRSEKGEHRTTSREASIMLWDEVKKANNLGTYNY